MKYLIAVVFLIFIVMASIPPRDRCDIVTARLALPVRIFAETTIDGRDQPVAVTRFFHNKVTIITNELARCYLNFFDPNLIAQSASLPGLLPWLYFAYRVAILTPRYPQLAALLLIPVLPIMTSFPQVAYFHKLFAIIGLVLWAKR
ncbi:hypothetical protein HYZ70_00685 [Candidatus Curtissbacteria bacterium]|nr:hypothetical protein [Candidatus Curtissbacteria bacterium]